MRKLAILLWGSIFLFSCKKDKSVADQIVTDNQIIQDIATNVIADTYSELKNQSNQLFIAIQNFISNPTTSKLEECKTHWKSTRRIWEMSEGFIYGPVATEDIDPKIDTWPVDFNAIETELSGTIDFSDDLLFEQLDNALKGFHPMEYLLWGENGHKTIAEFTNREFEYLNALGKDLQSKTEYLHNEWNSSNLLGYFHVFVQPGESNTYYSSMRSIYEEVVNGMIGICDEVAGGKIGEPFVYQDPSLEESPFSSNSLEDFQNNIRSIQHLYLGKFTNDQLGIEDFVRKYNLSLDNTIKTKLNTVFYSFNTITMPFGEAILQQPTQIQNTISALMELKETLEESLLPLIEQHVTN